MISAKSKAAAAKVIQKVAASGVPIDARIRQTIENIARSLLVPNVTGDQIEAMLKADLRTEIQNLDITSENFQKLLRQEIEASTASEESSEAKLGRIMISAKCKAAAAKVIQKVAAAGMQVDASTVLEVETFARDCIDPETESEDQIDMMIAADIMAEIRKVDTTSENFQKLLKQEIIEANTTIEANATLEELSEAELGRIMISAKSKAAAVQVVQKMEGAGSPVDASMGQRIESISGSLTAPDPTEDQAEFDRITEVVGSMEKLKSELAKLKSDEQTRRDNDNVVFSQVALVFGVYGFGAAWVEILQAELADTGNAVTIGTKLALGTLSTYIYFQKRKTGPDVLSANQTSVSADEYNPPTMSTKMQLSNFSAKQTSVSADEYNSLLMSTKVKQLSNFSKSE
jgi:hypothetical protein